MKVDLNRPEDEEFQAFLEIPAIGFQEDHVFEDLKVQIEKAKEVA